MEIFDLYNGHIEVFIYMTAFTQFWFAVECIRHASRIKGPKGHQSKVMSQPRIKKAVLLQHALSVCAVALALSNLTQILGLYLVVTLWVLLLIVEKRWTIWFYDNRKAGWRERLADENTPAPKYPLT